MTQPEYLQRSKELARQLHELIVQNTIHSDPTIAKHLDGCARELRDVLNLLSLPSSPWLNVLLNRVRY